MSYVLTYHNSMLKWKYQLSPEKFLINLKKMQRIVNEKCSYIIDQANIKIMITSQIQPIQRTEICDILFKNNTLTYFQIHYSIVSK